MKIIYVLELHSMVDTITNSSTEVFVYTGKKDLEVIDAMLRELVKSETIIPYEIEKAKKNLGEYEYQGYKFKKNNIIVKVDTHQDFEVIEPIMDFLENRLFAKKYWI